MAHKKHPNKLVIGISAVVILLIGAGIVLFSSNPDFLTGAMKRKKKAQPAKQRQEQQAPSPQPTPSPADAIIRAASNLPIDETFYRQQDVSLSLFTVTVGAVVDSKIQDILLPFTHSGGNLRNFELYKDSVNLRDFVKITNSAGQDLAGESQNLGVNDQIRIHFKDKYDELHVAAGTQKNYELRAKVSGFNPRDRITTAYGDVTRTLTYQRVAAEVSTIASRLPTEEQIGVVAPVTVVLSRIVYSARPEYDAAISHEWFDVKVTGEPKVSNFRWYRIEPDGSATNLSDRVRIEAWEDRDLKADVWGPFTGPSANDETADFIVEYLDPNDAERTLDAGNSRTYELRGTFDFDLSQELKVALVPNNDNFTRTFWSYAPVQTTIATDRFQSQGVLAEGSEVPLFGFYASTGDHDAMLNSFSFNYTEVGDPLVRNLKLYKDGEYYALAAIRDPPNRISYKDNGIAEVSNQTVLIVIDINRLVYPGDREYYELRALDISNIHAGDSIVMTSTNDEIIRTLQSTDSPTLELSLRNREAIGRAGARTNSLRYAFRAHAPENIDGVLREVILDANIVGDPQVESILILSGPRSLQYDVIDNHISNGAGKITFQFEQAITIPAGTDREFTVWITTQGDADESFSLQLENRPETSASLRWR